MRIFQEGTRQIDTGSLEHRVRITSGDEFEFLAEEFAKMVEQLSCYHANHVEADNAAMRRRNSAFRRREERALQVLEKSQDDISLI